MSRTSGEATSSFVAGGDDGTGPTRARETFRERHRRERHQEFLDTALEIVVAEGLSALTMQRVTDQLQCATGSIYSYFPTKDALIAGVQGEALQHLAVSVQSSQGHLEALLDGRDERFRSLARLVAASRFWVGAEVVFPQEIVLCRMIFSDPRDILAEDEAEPVLSPAIALISFASGLLDAAVASGALDEGDSFERATIVLAGATGVLFGSGLARWDARLLESRRIANSMITDLFIAWGADPDAVGACDAIVAELARADHLVPPAVTGHQTDPSE